MESQKNNNQSQMMSKNNDEKGQKTQPVYMWESFSDYNGKTQWRMMHFYQHFFESLIEVIGTLRQTVYKKWTAQQISSYQRFLKDLQDYVVRHIFTGQVADLNLFYDALDEYAIKHNPQGAKLYDSQLDYLQRKQDRQTKYNFKLDKKKKKAYKPQYKKTKTYVPKNRNIQKKQINQDSDSSFDEKINPDIRQQQVKDLVEKGFTYVEKPKPKPKYKEAHKKQWHEKHHE